jgi:serine/threonine-protein kinase
VTPHPLLDVDEIPETDPYLREVGEVFRAYREQDSGCVSYGVRLPDGKRWFVKEPTTDGARWGWARRAGGTRARAAG